MVDIGKVLFERPKNTGFRFGLIAILLVSIALIYPAFFQLGYADPVILQYLVIAIIGLIMSIMFSFALANQTKTKVDTRMTGDALWKQMRVLVVGVIAGLVLVAVNVITGRGITVLVGDVSDTNLFMLGLLAGVSEELFFRGFIQNMIRVYVPSMIFALLPSAFIFAMFHYFTYGLDVTALGVMFALGLFLGILHEVFDDIGVPMLAHVINNVFATLPMVLLVLTDNIIVIVLLVGLLIMSYVYAVMRRR